MEGWIKLHRKIIDTPLWLSEPFSRSQAWIDLLILANSSDGFFFKRGIRVDVKRGQIGHDLDTLAKKWKWSRGKVNRFISMLEMDRQIVRQKTNVTTLLTIVNYNIYQSNGKANSTTNDKPNGHQTVEQTDTNKNDKNKKEGEEYNTWRKNFEIYKSELLDWFENIKSDSEYLSEQEKFNPGIDVILSIEKSIKVFWGTEAGWKNKKKSKTVNIDWKTTIAKNLDKNKVYKQNETNRRTNGFNSPETSDAIAATERIFAEYGQGNAYTYPDRD